MNAKVINCGYLCASMMKVHDFIRHTILAIIDGVYPLFKKIMPQQTFRYAACGGGNTILDITLFFVSYNYILHKLPIHIGWLTISPHIMSFIISFCATFPIGFYLSRYVVFQETTVKKSQQLAKYFFVVFGCILLNYIFLKLFVDYFGWYPTPAKIATTFFVIIFSYTSQKNYTFKSGVPEEA
jgi:putative flippase GtrA